MWVLLISICVALDKTVKESKTKRIERQATTLHKCVHKTHWANATHRKWHEKKNWTTETWDWGCTQANECERMSGRKLGKQKYTQTLNESENTDEKESTL